MSNNIGKSIHNLGKKIWPHNRSLTGHGVVKTLNELKKINPDLKIKKFKSGAKVFDWKIPDEWNGHKVLGIADGEYIETDELVGNGNEIDFETKTIADAIAFASEFKWNTHPNFDEAMKQIQLIVNGN